MPETINNFSNDNENYLFSDVMDSTIKTLTEKFVENENEYLLGKAIVTNVGVFTYNDHKNGIIRMLRPPEEVFKKDSLESLKMLPITNEHCKSVNIDNIKNVQVGTTGSEFNIDNYAISIPLKIYDKKTIKDIKSGKNALSCGYSATIDYKSGNWLGIQYDAIQKDIKYNHVAIVKEGRAGDLAKMIMDSKSMIFISNNNKGDIKMDNELKKIIIDEIEYQADEAIINKYNDFKKTLELKDAKVNELEKNLKTKKDELKDLKDELKEVKEKLEKQEINDEKFKEILKERTKLVEICQKSNINYMLDSTNIEIKNNIITKIFPKLDLKDKSTDYISGRFDAAIEYLEKEIEDSNAKKILNNNIEKNKTVNSVDAFNNYTENLRNAWKQGV